MTAESEDMLVRMFEAQIDAYASLDTDRLLATFRAEDCTLQDMSDPENGTYTGLDEIRGFLVDYFATLKDVSVEFLAIATGENLVVGEIKVNATYIGAPFSAENGRPVVLRYVVLNSVQDGMISHERFYWNPADLADQLAAQS